MRLAFLSIFILSSWSLQASIFGPDDRVDTINASTTAQELARSVPALVQKYRLKTLSDGRFELTGRPLVKFNFCADEVFAEETNIANCSASFIGGDKILTAAHCFDERAYACETYSVVFDYARSEVPMSGPHLLDSSQVYHCKDIVFSEFDKTMAGIDLAIIELDRDVEGREPIRLNLKQELQVHDPLVLIGYPMGISQKVVETGKVLSVDPKHVSFKHDLDSFSVNSGSPIFSQHGEQVGVMVRGTGPNFVEKPGRSCYGWHVEEGEGYSEGNDLSPLAELKL